jgi:hypothetical protein
MLLIILRHSKLKCDVSFFKPEIRKSLHDAQQSPVIKIKI